MFRSIIQSIPFTIQCFQYKHQLCFLKHCSIFKQLHHCQICSSRQLITPRWYPGEKSIYSSGQSDNPSGAGKTILLILHGAVQAAGRQRGTMQRVFCLDSKEGQFEAKCRTVWDANCFQDNCHHLSNQSLNVFLAKESSFVFVCLHSFLFACSNSNE